MTSRTIAALALALLPTTASAQKTITTFAGGGPGPASHALTVALSSPGAAVADGAGNLYVSMFINSQIWRINLATGAVVVVAGTGFAGFSGDGGPAINAQFLGAAGLALDGAGNLYIADTQNNRIRKVTAATGIITTIAGTGAAGFAGDGGSPTSAQFRAPSAIAIAGNGDIFISDTNNHRIRKIVAALNVVITVAGNGTAGFSGDGGSATSAQLRTPRGLALDAAGNILIVDSQNHRVRRVSGGVITTVAGSSASGFAGDGGPATAARLLNPFDIVVDGSGSFSLTDQSNHRIRRVDGITGVITTIGGTGVVGFTGDGGQATAARFNFPQGLALDTNGHLFITDFSNRRVRKIDLAGVVTTVVGNGLTSLGGDNAHATSAQLSGPRSPVIDAAGHIYFVDGETIRRIDANTSLITTVAGVPGQSGFNGDGILATSALLLPASLAMDSLGNLYIGESARVRKVNAQSGIISTVAGNGTNGLSGDGGPATSAQLNGVRGVAVASNGDIYIAEFQNHRVRKVTAATGAITTFAGTVSGFAGDGGPATSARLFRPSGLAVSGAGDLYISDTINNRIRKVSPSGIISTVAGNGTLGFSGDGGPATSAALFQPEAGVAIDASGTLYIPDTQNSRIRAVTGGIISTVAGSGTRGFFGDGGSPTAAQLATPQGVAVAGGRLYIADTNNNRVRLVEESNHQPIAEAGQPQTIEATGAQTAVHLDASASSDADGDVLTYEWRTDLGTLIASAAVADLLLPLGSHVFTVTVRDPAGATSSDTVTVVVQDTIGPTITLTSPQAGSYDLLDTVIAGYTCSDAVSGTVQCSGPVANGTAIDTSTAGSKSFTVLAEDVRGNVSSMSLTYSVSKGVPGIVWPQPLPVTIGTPLGPTHLNATAEYRATPVPGTFTYSPAPTSTLGIGIHTLNVVFAPTDSLNYTGASATKTLTVTNGVCALFDETKAHRVGSTVPVKIQLCDTAGGNRSANNIAVTARGFVMVSNSASYDVEDAGNANPDSDFRYDPTLGDSGGYIFNLQTKGRRVGTYRLEFVVSGDPVTHSVIVQLR